jgi:uncharacterized protein YjiS (DUF1127 family)
MREAALFIAQQGESTDSGFLSTLVRHLRNGFRSWRSRRGILPLAEFDDHLLADIGLTRDDVRRALDLPLSHDPGMELQRLAFGNRERRWNV